MASKIIILNPGDVFGRLTLIQKVPTRHDRKIRWMCRCICGAQCVVQQHYLRTGHTKSCGCYCKDINSALHRTHGRTHTTEYNIWASMIQRCENPKNAAFPDYGGRGIAVCERWRHDYTVFLADMGTRPSPRHTIERKNNSLGYSPENCIWATFREQQRNRRSNHWITFNGETKVLNDWAATFKIQRATLKERLRHGWSIERALTESVRHISRKKSAEA
jgi:hypothetical protein